MTDTDTRIERILGDLRVRHAEITAHRRRRRRGVRFAVLALIFVTLGAASALGAQRVTGFPTITPAAESNSFPSHVYCTSRGATSATCEASGVSSRDGARYDLTGTLSLLHSAGDAAESVLPALTGAASPAPSTQSVPPADTVYRGQGGDPLALACAADGDALSCTAIGVGTGLPTADKVALYELTSN